MICRCHVCLYGSPPKKSMSNETGLSSVSRLVFIVASPTPLRMVGKSVDSGRQWSARVPGYCRGYCRGGCECELGVRPVSWELVSVAVWCDCVVMWCDCVVMWCDCVIMWSDCVIIMWCDCVVVWCDCVIMWCDCVVMWCDCVIMWCDCVIIMWCDCVVVWCDCVIMWCDYVCLLYTSDAATRR